jgi:hypothetical protein
VSEVEGGVSTCFGEVGGVGAGGVVEEASVTANSTRKPQAGGPVKRKPQGGRTEDRPRVKEAAGSHLHAHHSIVCSICVRGTYIRHEGTYKSPDALRACRLHPEQAI